MTPSLLDLLRFIVAGTAVTVAGAVATLLVIYLRSAWRNGRRAPGAILVRHVAEVAAGTLGLVVGNGYAVYVSIGEASGAPAGRLLLYLVSMLLLLLGMIEVGNLQRRRRPDGRHHFR